jgi:SAM-dependent methyltransferase
LFPYATLLALDGEETMRAAARENLIPVGKRADVDVFDLYSTDWFPRLEGADCVVSSLCIHHLNDAEKRTLFRAVYGRMSPKGALLIADLVKPIRAEARELFASTWDRSAQQQSIAKTGTTELYDRFVSEQWNYYHYPDPFDKPSGLYEQLTWLKEVGFTVVDCFWMQAGHAIYGGYKQAATDMKSGGTPFAEAFAIANIVLGNK